MRCQSCDHENREQASFCERCGTRLSQMCRRCGSRVPASARFCESCGRPLADTAAGAAGGSDGVGVAERRRVTVMFCDVADSTRITDRIDPEDWREAVVAYHELCSQVIGRFGGTVAQYLGDGVLAYFGYPVAKENDAQSAVRAGLELARLVPGLSARLALSEDLPLDVRVGIHTGLAVAGDAGIAGNPDGGTVVGVTPNIAARVQGVAARGQVAISEATLQLVRGFFECTDLGARELKGVEQPIRIHQVLGESDASSRIDVALRTGFTPMVGREDEMAVLLEHWSRAANGKGSVVLLSGEAGIGKSRLIRELRGKIDGAHGYLEGRCVPYLQASALHPVVDLLRRAWDLGAAESVETARGRMVDALSGLGIEPDRSVPLLAELLSLPVRDSEALDLTPQRRRQLTLEILVELSSKLSERAPLLLVIEDLHWADPSTLELLELLVLEVPGSRILTLLTHRPEFEAPWTGTASLEIPRLDRAQSAELLSHVVGEKALAPEVLSALRDRAEGVPLYAEELTRMVLDAREDGVGAVRAVAGAQTPIPATLHESLMARLDKLGGAKDLVQIAAAIGRAFDPELISAVSSLSSEAVDADLARLVAAGVLHPGGESDSGAFVFKHALIQDAAYESMLRRRRQQVHRRIAEVTLELFPQVANAQPELLAHHYVAGELHDEALDYCQRAGDLALRRSAFAEAVSHFRLGLQELEKIPGSPERTQKELALLTGLGSSLMPARGYASPEVEDVYRRAHAITENAGASRELFLALSGLGYFHQSRAELHTARSLAERRLDLARKLGDPALEMQAHEGIGTASHFLGEYDRAVEAFDRCMEIYDPDAHSDMALLFGQDIGVVCQAYTAQAVWAYGRVDDSVEHGRRAIALARRISHANSVALALSFFSAVRVLRGEAAEAQAAAEEAIALATEQQFPFWLGYGRLMLGWAWAAQGRGQEGVAKIIEGFGTWAGTGAQLGVRFSLSLLAEAQRLAGDLEGATGSIEAAASPDFDKNEDRYWDGEVSRTRGEILLLRDPDAHAEAERHFETALAHARAQSHLTLELRAAASLARLLRSRDRPDEAERLLRPILDRFTQGLDTPLVSEARAILA